MAKEKVMSVRLDAKDMENVVWLQKYGHGGKTINGTISRALRMSVRYVGLIGKLNKCFDKVWHVKEEKLVELNREHGFLQREIF